MTRKLTEKEKMFAKEYLVTNSGAASARKAGYSAKAAKEIACVVLKRPHVKEYIDELNEARSKRLEINADRVLKELAKIAFVDPTNVFDVDEEGNLTFRGKLSDLSPEERACISEVTQNVTENGGSTRVKLYDKLSALEKIGKHLKLFTDVTETKFDLTQMGRVMVRDGDKIMALEFNVGQEPNDIDAQKK
ncbi:terminase small subunit [Candidatus Pacearchaeota archaeon]|nr:terminase small subunit [Candidatus Pacearchaeota archaeon]